MIEFDDKTISIELAERFGLSVASIARANTGFDFIVRPVGDETVEILTSHPDAIKAEYGTVDAPGGSWSVKALLEAERRLNEQSSGGI